MTDEELQAIEARANAATPGPWEVFAEREVSTEHKALMGCTHDGDGVFYEREDAEFVAHARADIPALVAEVRRLRGALGRLGSCEAFTYAMAINSNDPREELRVRVDFAREAMK
jgi:hypothetical protein